MKIDKELFRNFYLKLRTYFSGPDAPDAIDMSAVIESVEADVETVESAEATEALDDQKFQSIEDKALKLLDKIAHNAKEGQEGLTEKKLSGELKTQIEEQFKLLESQYQQALDELGASNPKLRELQTAMHKAATEFMDRVETHIMQKNLEMGNTESLTNVVENYFKGKKFRTRGFAKYLLEGNPELAEEIKGLSTLGSKEEFHEALGELLDDEDVLENAVRKMAESLPRFDENEEEKNYFKGLIDASADKGKDKLSYQFGTDNIDDATTTLSKRFHIQFLAGSNDPEYIVDLVDGNKLYKPGGSWEAKLKSICHSFKGEKPFQREEEKIQTQKEQKEEMVDELLSGTAGDTFAGLISFGLIDTDMELEDLASLKNNIKLQKLINMTGEHAEAINGDLNRDINQLKLIAKSAKGIGSERLRGISGMNAERVRSIPGLLASLRAIIRMLSGKVDSGKRELAKDIDKGIERGENPVDGMKLSKKEYMDFLNAKKPTIDSLLPALSSNTPILYAAIFTTNEDPANFDREQANKYSSQGKEAVHAYLKETLGFDQLASVTKDLKNPDTYILNVVKGGNLKQFSIKKMEGDKLQITDLDDKNNPQTIENSMVALKTAMAKQPEAVAKAEAKEAEGAREKAAYKAFLDELAQEGDPNVNTSPIKELAKLIKKKGVQGKIPKYNDKLFNKKNRPKGMKRQEAVDRARAEFLIANLPVLKLVIKKNEKYAALIKSKLEKAA